MSSSRNQSTSLHAVMSLAPAASVRSKDIAPTSGSAPAIQELDSAGVMGNDTSTAPDSKSTKRTLFGLGKKRPTPAENTSITADDSIAASPQPGVSRSSSARMSPTPHDSAHVVPTTPGRGVGPSSPRLSSPAGSQIFERDVQESAAVMPNSPAIPSHIQTEDHIPPVLDASSEAITDGHLSPDAVEIVTHNLHQPAAVTVTGAIPNDSMSGSWAEDLAEPSADKEETASNYGSLDSADVRRLSFISFADVVQAEQPTTSGGSRESIHLAGMTSLSALGHRSPSPMRSPVSSQGPEGSPPTSNPGSVKGLNASPGRRSLVSPIAMEHGSSNPGDLSIETMSQALRRTGSTDLSAARSQPVSPIEGPSR